jgi:hypothetical protein
MKMNPCRRTEKSNDDIKIGLVQCPEKGRTVTYVLVLRCPVYRGRDSSLGLRAELENLRCDAKGKGPSGGPARPKVPKRAFRGGPPRSSGEPR